MVRTGMRLLVGSVQLVTHTVQHAVDGNVLECISSMLHLASMRVQCCGLWQGILCIVYSPVVPRGQQRDFFVYETRVS